MHFEVGEPKEGSMATSGTIDWKSDFEVALEQARPGKRHLLLDFSAAPM